MKRCDVATVIPFALAIILVGCRPQTATPPPPDFTILKRDLLELDQSLALSRRTGVVQPDRFVAALDQLERDVRLQRDKPTGVAQQGVEAVLANAQVLRQAAGHYAQAASIYAPYSPPPDANKTTKDYWDLLKQAYLAFHPSPSEDRIDLVVQALEAAEHPAAKK
jgi:hypothetical protein